MSKKTKFVFYGLNFLFLFSVIFYGQKQEVPFKPTDNEVLISKSDRSSAELLEDSLKVTFEISLAKTDLLMLEPLVLNSRFSNQTNGTLEFYEPNLVNQLGMKSVLDGEVDVDRRLFSHYINKPNRIRILKPDEFVEEVVVLEPGAGLFKSAGRYDVQFFISYGDQKIWSNTLTVSVREPGGIDREARDFLRTNLASEYDLFNSSDSGMVVTQSLLERFINEYASSIYHDYAVLSLSNLYNASKQYKKAKNELLKLKGTQIELMDSLVEKRLADLPDSPS